MENKPFCFALPLFSLLLMLPLFGCAPSKQPQSNEALFSYNNQADWLFEAGKLQSPINIDTSITQKKIDTNPLSLNYSDSVSYDPNDAHTIKIKVAGEAKIDGRTFKLQQFHFHAPSEHTVDGQFFPLEFHFVHQAQNGRNAVVGVFIKKGQKNLAFQTLLDRHAKTGSEKLTNIDVNSLLPKDRSYYHYLGSLTTPPLSENVEWYVLSTPIEASAEQIKYYESHYNNTNREVQALADRNILVYQE